MEKYITLSGRWEAVMEDLGTHDVILPGTLDTNYIGHKDTEKLTSRLTRLHTYEGEVCFLKKLRLPGADGKRLFLEAERARQLRLKINGNEIPACVPGTLSTPYVYEVTAYAGQDAELELLSDNRYIGWPRDSIIGASAATDETQTNWNGILGYLRLRLEEKFFLEDIRVYPHGELVDVEAVVNGLEDLDMKCRLVLESPAFQNKVDISIIDGLVMSEGQSAQEHFEVVREAHRACIKLCGIRLTEEVKRWDEEEGNLYEAIGNLTVPGYEESRRKVTFGVRDFGYNRQLRLTINDRAFFLRGEANCCVFPEEGHPPMTKEAWKRVLGIYASYGVNCMRFHSWCPPDAAFQAADEMGMMMQPELSHWNYKDAFASEESFAYYKLELKSILASLANHPSFVMITWGNELYAGETGMRRMDELLKLAKEMDHTRLYAIGSNCYYGERGADPGSDFYTSMGYYKEMLRAVSSPMIGHLNHEYPSGCHNYNETVEKIHREGKPVFGFEVGQYEILPDFQEIADFRGVTRGINLELVREQVEKAGYLEDWENYVEAAGELALLGYREEVEAVLRTPGMSGLSLLGLQDFPGQGTALVGMLNSHLRPKPYAFAQPERFRSFFRSVLPLLLLPKYTYEGGERLLAECRLANYGKEVIKAGAEWKLVENTSASRAVSGNKSGVVLQSGHFPEELYENQGLRFVGMVELEFDMTDQARRLDLEITVGDYKNVYPVWVYPKRDVITCKGKEVCWDKGKTCMADDHPVKIVSVLTEDCLREIEEGAVVLIDPAPTPENLPSSIGGQFSTDFWSVGTFPEQEGGMGMVIDTLHPIFDTYPTQAHSSWQWWAQASGRPMILPGAIRPVVTVPDSYSRLKHMGLLFEARMGRGAVMVSSMGLLDKQQYPECRELLYSILRYMAEEAFQPAQRITREQLEEIVAVR